METRSGNDVHVTVKRYADAWAANDLKTIFNSYHEDEVFHVAVEQFERNGKVAVIGRLLRYRMREGKLCDCWTYDEDQRIVENSSLPDSPG